MNNYSKRRMHTRFIARLLIFLKKKGYDSEFDYINDIIEGRVGCVTYSNISKDLTEIFIWESTPQKRKVWLKIHNEYETWLIENKGRKIK